MFQFFPRVCFRKGAWFFLFFPILVISKLIFVFVFDLDILCDLYRKRTFLKIGFFSVSGIKKCALPVFGYHLSCR